MFLLYIENAYFFLTLYTFVNNIVVEVSSHQSSILFIGEGAMIYPCMFDFNLTCCAPRVSKSAILCCNCFPSFVMFVAQFTYFLPHTRCLYSAY